MTDTILIVDDNLTYAKWTEAVLRQAGYDIAFAESARTGLSQAVENPDKFQAVFSDITMEHPGAGLVLIPKLRSRGYKGITVLVSTGFDYPIVFWLSKLTLPLIGVDGLVIKKAMRDAGKWRIEWISKRNGIRELKDRIGHIVDIPNWVRPK